MLECVCADDALPVMNDIIPGFIVPLAFRRPPGGRCSLLSSELLSQVRSYRECKTVSLTCVFVCVCVSADVAEQKLCQRPVAGGGEPPAAGGRVRGSDYAG